MVQALFDRKILMDYLNSGFLADDPAVWMLYKLLAIAMMNEDQKRASFSATPVFAELRQLTNEIEEARQYLILAGGNQQNRCFLLSSYESVLLARTKARLVLRTLTWKRTGRRPPVQMKIWQIR
jgi:hypothetical protein